MSASTLRVALLAALVLAMSPLSGYAQHAPGMPGDLLSDNYNLQLFEPFDLDLDNRPVRGRVGYSFGIDKLYWNVSGERVELGQPGGLQTAEVIFRQTTNAGGSSEGTPPTPFQIPNGIQDAAPDAEFGYGERYELGYSDGNTGIKISILDGPSINSSNVYGFGDDFLLLNQNSDTPGVDPFYTGPAIDANGNGIGDGNGPTGDFRAFGFGSVPVSFAAPAGYFLGFRDYLINFAGAVNGTNSGPIQTQVNVGGLQEDQDQDDDTLAEVLFFADDLDGDGNPGGIVGINPATGQIFVTTDFDDLHEFNVFFDEVSVRNVTESQGIELMRTFEIDNRNRMRRHQNNRFQLAYGVRLLRIRDFFGFTGEGSILGETRTATEVDNQLIGPQIALNYTKHRGQWLFEAQGRAFAAYNIADVSQTNLFGAELIPGGINRPLFARSTASTYGEQKEDFSPFIELRLNSRYQMTNSVSLNLGYTMMFVDNIHRGGLSTLWQTPGFTNAAGATTAGFGIGDGKTHMIINGVNFGIEGRF